MSEQVLEGVAEGLVVRPGDTLVLRLEGDVSPETARRAKETVEARVPGVPVLIVAGAEQIAVVRAGEDAQG
jgi:hypothetical protein